MMSEAPSKRLRLRFFPEDERSVREILSGTKHSSQSNVIRSALALYEQVWSSKRMGFRIVYRQEETAECPDALDFPVRAMPGDGSGKRAKTERSIEIRVTPSDCERIESLIAMEAADTFSEVVRRAVRLYANVVARHKDGWELVAVSPSGDVLPLPVPGIGGVAKRPIATTLPLIPIRTAVVEPASLSALLPRSLDTIVNNLAAHEQCAADVLLVDMVRTEALARLRRLELGEPQPEPTAVEAELTQLVETMAVANTATAEKIPTEEQVSAATIETATSVPIPETPLAITEPPLAPISAQQDTYVIEQILTTLDMTSSLTEELVELVESLPNRPRQWICLPVRRPMRRKWTKHPLLR